MNSIVNEPSGGIDSQKNPIRDNYLLGVDYYRNSVKILKNSAIRDIRGEDEGLSQRTLAIEYLEKAIMEVGTCEQQLTKIDAYLLLIEINTGSGTTKIRDDYPYDGVEIPRTSLQKSYPETPDGKTIMEAHKSYIDPNDYLYGAIEIARRYLGDEYSHTSYGDRIMKMYISYIDPTFLSRFSEEHIPFLLPLLHNNMLLESQGRVRLSLEEAANIAKMVNTNEEAANIAKMVNTRDSSDDIASELEDVFRSSDKIISKLEDIFGPLRILIISEESSQECVSHRVDEGDISPSHMKHMSVNIFDKPRGYSVGVDRGSNEAPNQFKESHFEHIINPIIRILIAKKEYESFEYTDDNMGMVETFEKINFLPSELNDYSSFITDVMKQYGRFTGLHGIQNNIDMYSRAIDICRGVMFSLGKDDDISQDNLLNTIDGILGGRIDVITLRKVQSILLSCDETMNGTGYPFGLSRNDIPLEGKIYSIIRAYEALCFYYNKKQALERLQKWAKYGYFDIDILHIFLENIKKDDIPTKQIMDITHIMSDISLYRRPHYEKHLNSWFHQLKIIRSIEDGYNEFRKAEGDENSKAEGDEGTKVQGNKNIQSEGNENIKKKGNKSIQKVVIKKINELSLELRKLALIRKLFIITRHGPTKNDRPGGPPGDDHELLTTQGIVSSRIKGALLYGLDFQIVTSPLVRACQTALIICQRVRGCVCKIIETDRTLASSIGCPGVTREMSIGNPKKDRDDGRYNSSADSIFSGTKELKAYVLKMVSSSTEAMTLFIMHRDSARHMIFWLKNQFDKDRIHYEKIPIDNDIIYEFYYKGDHLIEGEEAKTKGLLFSTVNWRVALHEVNSIVENIFGDTFYSVDDEGIDLFILNDKFINFIHRKNEESPEKIGLFVEQLSSNTFTKHFPDILKGAGLI